MQALSPSSEWIGARSAAVAIWSAAVTASTGTRAPKRGNPRAFRDTGPAFRDNVAPFWGERVVKCVGHGARRRLCCRQKRGSRPAKGRVWRQLRHCRYFLSQGEPRNGACASLEVPRLSA